jgi:multidrug resistance protein MdtO
LVSKWIALSSLRVKKYLHEIHVLVQPEIHAAAQAIAAVLDEIAHELLTHIAVGADTTPPASRSRARSALEPLNARIIHVRPAYIGKVSSAEIENFASFTDSLAALTGHIERLLDEPPPATGPSKKAVPPLLNAPDPSISRYSLKVGACAVAGYIVGVTIQRADLSTIVTTVLVTALPTYGAALRKMILRIIGAAIGGAIALLTIITRDL